MHLFNRRDCAIVVGLTLGMLPAWWTPADADVVPATDATALVTGLQSTDPGTRIASAHSIAALDRVPTNAIPVLVDALDDMYFDVRMNATKALGKIGKEAIPPLMTALASDDYYMALYAARAVGELGDIQAEADLARQLIHNTRLPGADQERQVFAARALMRVKCRDTNLMNELKSAYESTNNDLVQHGLAMSMTYLGEEANVMIPVFAANIMNRPHAKPVLQEMGRAAVPAMIKKLQGAADNREVWNLYEFFGGLGADGAPAIPFLVKELQEPRDPWFGELAARLLGQIGVFDESVLGALEAARHSSVKSIANAAEESLAKRKSP
jgi:hypothetical protein